MITSLSNPRVKAAVKLYRRPHRNRSGLTLVEGFRQIRMALDAGIRLESLFFCRELWLGSSEDDLLEVARNRNIELMETTSQVFSKLSMRDRSDGLLAVAGPPRADLGDLVMHPGALVVVVEAVEKPGNLGALLRSCDGAGVTAVISCDPTTDLHNPNVIRSSLGTIFSLPVVQCSTSEALAWLREQGLQVVAASPEGARPYHDLELRPPLAIVLGCEQYGLSETWRQAPDLELARIPMLGAADSLNVAQAGTLLVYEVLRQQSRPGGESGAV